MSRVIVKRKERARQMTLPTRLLRTEQMLFELNAYVVRLINAGGEPSAYDKDLLEAVEEYKAFLEKGRE